MYIIIKSYCYCLYGNVVCENILQMYWINAIKRKVTCYRIVCMHTSVIN